jgi:hypothetical protein
MIWQQVYVPLNDTVLSTLCVGIPVLVLVGDWPCCVCRPTGQPSAA